MNNASTQTTNIDTADWILTCMNEVNARNNSQEEFAHFHRPDEWLSIDMSGRVHTFYYVTNLSEDGTCLYALIPILFERDKEDWVVDTDPVEFRWTVGNTFHEPEFPDPVLRHLNLDPDIELISIYLKGEMTEYAS